MTDALMNEAARRAKKGGGVQDGSVQDAAPERAGARGRKRKH